MAARKQSTLLACRPVAASLALLTAGLLWGSPREADNGPSSQAETTPPMETPGETPLADADYDHWAWRPLARPEIPVVQNASWPRTPIDRFILARLEKEGLSPSPPADRAELIRRVTYDLTGLPPAPEEIKAFCASDSPTAYEELVDRLLASGAYGERMAQHWLDLARYADTDGFEHDKVRPRAWRYRDWTIAALNQDLPYDEFVRLQLAGDELRPGDEGAAIATGFCLCGPDMPDINLQQERRHNVLNELVSAVGAVFLGLQIGCAQCHDHKSDPISQADFYRLRSLFEPGVALKDSPLGRTLWETSSAAEPSYLWQRGDFRRPGPIVAPGFPRLANREGIEIPLPAPEAKSTGRRAALAQWLTRPDNPLATRVIVNRLWQIDFGRGLCDAPSDFGLLSAPPSHPELLDYLATELPRLGFSLKRMHRLFVTSAVYRQASRPAAATEHDAEQAATPWGRGRRIDPDNRLWWRMNRRRLDAEAIRDGMLAAAGALSQRRGGEGIMTPFPQELLATTVSADWKPAAEGEDHRRRSIYLFVRRNLREPFLEAFDRPDAVASCPRRGTSTVAPQALALFNSEFSLDCARRLAAQSAREAGGLEGRIDCCYLRALGRSPDRQERELAVAFLERTKARLLDEAAAEANATDRQLVAADAAETEALERFCLALFNLNEFVYLD